MALMATTDTKRTSAHQHGRLNHGRPSHKAGDYVNGYDFYLGRHGLCAWFSPFTTGYGPYLGSMKRNMLLNPILNTGLGFGFGSRTH